MRRLTLPPYVESSGLAAPHAQGSEDWEEQATLSRLAPWASIRPLRRRRVPDGSDGRASANGTRDAA